MSIENHFPASLTVSLILVAVVSLAQAQYSGGTGEADDPYQIATAADLIALGETPDDYDKHFILTADIDLDPNLPGAKVFDRAVIAPDDIAQPLYHSIGSPFTGVLDGNGYRILNLAISGEDYIGLIGELGSGGQVRNLGVVDVRIVSSGWCVGGLAGRMKDALVTRCYSTGVVTGGSAVGGLIGRNGYEGGGEVFVSVLGGVIDQCYSTASVSGSTAVGGLVGANEAGSVTCSYALGSITGNTSIGGLVGVNSRFDESCTFSLGVARVFQCYATGAVVGEDYTGGLVGRSGSSSGITASFWDIEASGLLKMCGFDFDDTGCDDSHGKTTAEMQTASTFLEAGWQFVNYREVPQDYVWAEPEGGGYPVFWWQSSSLPSLPAFSGGTGEAADPYLISTVEELNSICCNPRLMAYHFKLVNDLDLADVHFYPIGEGVSDIEEIYYPFYYPNLEWYRGVFDGNGHTIRHLAIDGGSCVGLFRCLAPRGEIHNLGVVDVNMSGSDGVGALAAWNGGTVTNCYSTGMISGDNDVGGLLGFNAGIVTRSYSAVVITGDNSVGGLVGNSTGSLTYCHSTAVVNGTGGPVGGLAGSNNGIITTSYSTGAVRGDDNLGGLVGWNSGDVTMSYSTGSVSGDSDIGGLVGWNFRGNVTMSYSVGAVSGNEAVGGLVGRGRYESSSGYVYEGRTFKSFWDIETSGQTESAGGTSLNTAGMQTATAFLDAGWDFIDETENGTEDIWTIIEGQTYPLLSWQKYGGGTGEPNDPYLIYTPEHLNALGAEPNDYDKHFKLMADIDLSEYDGKDGRAQFNIIGSYSRYASEQGCWNEGIPFSGVFDGQGHTISHLTFENEDIESSVGLFHSVNGTIRDLHVVDADVRSSLSGAGILVGKLLHSATISGCSVDRGYVCGRYSAGGLVAMNFHPTCGWGGPVSAGTISNCRIRETTVCVDTFGEAGGLVGYNYGMVSDSYADANVVGGEYAGGLVGSNGGSIANCYCIGQSVRLHTLVVS